MNLTIIDNSEWILFLQFLVLFRKKHCTSKDTCLLWPERLEGKRKGKIDFEGKGQEEEKKCYYKWKEKENKINQWLFLTCNDYSYFMFVKLKICCS